MLDVIFFLFLLHTPMTFQRCDDWAQWQTLRDRQHYALAFGYCIREMME